MCSSTEKLGQYVNKDIELMLPEDVSVKDIDWLSVYCKQAVVSFGDIAVTHDVTIPQYVSVSTSQHT